MVGGMAWACVSCLILQCLCLQPSLHRWQISDETEKYIERHRSLCARVCGVCDVVPLRFRATLPDRLYTHAFITAHLRDSLWSERMRQIQNSHT
jgi:hypothetical protein